MLESVYQSRLIRKLKAKFPGCVILKNDTDYQQGIPDLLVLYGDRWAMLEVKAAADSDQQPNQDYYVSLFDNMSYSAFIFPENEEAVLRELQQAFNTRRSSRLPKRQ